MKPNVVVELQGVVRIYRASPPHWALRGVTLAVPRGSFCLIEGPSGSGKTTLLGIIGALEQATEGSVRVCGREIGSASPEDLVAFRRRHLGFVFQDFRLIPALTAEENVRLPLRLRGWGRREARGLATAWLERLELGACIARRPAELSGGEKQRVAVARALAGEPDLLLADEPTANLDSKTGEALISLLRPLAAVNGATVLVASHDERLATHADRILHLLDGRIASEELRRCV
jgi:ABC-type lipoprotein export system ATPase subunit